MRNDAITKVIAKLNAMQQAAEAVEALKGQPSEDLLPELPELPAQAAGEAPGRPDIVPVSQPELPDLPDEAVGAAAGRPETVPHSRPELPPAAARFCEETGLPMVAMADDWCKEEPEEVEADLFG
jgi:hypothetical protein